MPQVFEHCRIQVGVDVLEPASPNFHLCNQCRKILEAGCGKRGTRVRRDVAAKSEIMIPPDSIPRKCLQQRHGFVHVLTVIEHVSQHDETVDLPCRELADGEAQQPDLFMDVGEKAETHGSPY